MRLSRTPGLVLCALALSRLSVALTVPPPVVKSEKTCYVSPLGTGWDDTDQVEAAIAKCGHYGTTEFAPGSYNITRKMTWDLVSSKVNLRGYLTYPPDINYWLDANNTYRVIFIQSQASWFVITGSDFEIDAFNTGGIQGNGQTWWSYFATHTRADGDGRPVSLTVYKALRGAIRNFRIVSPPFWANAIAESQDVLYDGMYVNATNEDSLYVGRNIVENTDGIDTYRSDGVSLVNWDVSNGDDCVAIKGNSSNLELRNITCHGGGGVAIGSLGQYVGMPDYVTNVEMDTLHMIRVDPNVQPIMASGVYFKSWDGSVNGAPPTGGGGAGGAVRNIIARNVRVDGVSTPVDMHQNNDALAGDLPSTLSFGDVHYINWTGTASTSTIVHLACSPAAICSDISFTDFHVDPPADEEPLFVCQNTADVTGLKSCNTTGSA